MKKPQTRHQPRTARRLSCAAVAFLGAAFALSACTSDDTSRDAAGKGAKPTPGQPKVTISAKQGAPAPPPQQPNAQGLQTISDTVLNTEIQPLDGKPFRLADFKGKVIMLNLWATWCGPCRYEVPHLIELTNEFGKKGVEVIGLTLENPETDEEKVRAFAEEFKINYKLGWARADFARELMQGRGSIPQSFIIEDGKILKKFIGFSPDKSPAMLRAAIEEAAGKASGD